MIDEDLLVAELARIADEVRPSAERLHDLLELAEDSGGRLSVFTRPGRVRTRFVAAAASAVLVAGTALVTWGTAAGPSLTSASSHGIPKVAENSLRSSQSADHSAGGSYYSPTGTGFSSSGSGAIAVTSSPVVFNGRADASTSSGSPSVGPRIESTGTVDLRVDRRAVGHTLTRLSALAARDHGTVASLHESSATKDGGRITAGEVVISVPQGAFTALVGQVQRLGRAISVHTSSTDVTSQYVDLRARISALQVSRHQYLAIMAKASTISGILAVQNQIDSLQSQIEQLQGQLNLLDHQTAYAELAVDVSSPTPHAPAPHHRSGVARAWDASVGGFVRAVEGLIRVSGPALFVLLCLGVLAVLGRGLWRYAIRRRL